MTKNYALFLLNQLCVGASVDAKPIIPQFELSQALNVAIKALEQEPCEDCIRRQAVLEVQTKYAEHMGATKYWQMRDDIRALPPVTPKTEQRWIPCTERLPKTNDIYLVSMHSYGLPTRAIDGYIQQTDKKWEIYGNKVIAWMPLPEPYKAESEEEI